MLRDDILMKKSIAKFFDVVITYVTTYHHIMYIVYFTILLLFTKIKAL